MSIEGFYDELAPLYHLVYDDWETSVARQGAGLASLIAENWGADARAVLAAALGIGTQALGLLARGFRVTGSDLSVGAVRRARREAAMRSLPLVSLVADFRALPVRSATFDVVLVCDNFLPHLDSAAEIRGALAECFRCVRRGGGCLISMRDYKSPPPTGTVEVRPYGDRLWAGRRYHLRQVWTWRGPRYDLSFEITPAGGGEAGATVLKTSYLAIPVEQVAGQMRSIGFENVRRVDGRFFQPVLVGTRPMVSLLDEPDAGFALLSRRRSSWALGGRATDNSGSWPAMPTSFRLVAAALAIFVAVGCGSPSDIPTREFGSGPVSEFRGQLQRNGSITFRSWNGKALRMDSDTGRRRGVWGAGASGGRAGLRGVVEPDAGADVIGLARAVDCGGGGAADAGAGPRRLGAKPAPDSQREGGEHPGC